MKNHFIALSAALILIGISLSSAHAAENKQDTSKIEMLDDAVMQKLVQSGDLLDQHQLLAALAGSWYYELRYWEKSGAEPQISSGIATSDLILDGKYLVTKTTLILNIGGQNIPYAGWGMRGYDDNKKLYSSVWADSMHAGFITGNGPYNEKTNSIEEKGFFKSPLSAKEQPYRSILQFTDDGGYTQTIFINGASSKEFKVIEVSFERR